jgi:TRAP transporter TAXI family solute receptor
MVLAGVASALASETKHPKTEISILSSLGGFPPTILSQALATILHQTHPWLRATNYETLGFGDNIKRMHADPAGRKDTLFMADGNIVWLASRGVFPFKETEKYDTWRAVALSNLSCVPIITLDPKIKTFRDLKGKRLNSGPRIAMMSVVIKACGEVEGGWGRSIYDKIKQQFMPGPPSKDALLDGLIDATQMPTASLAPTWVPGPLLMEITAGRRTYAVDWGKEALLAARDKYPLPSLQTVEIPPGAYGLSNKKPTTSPSGSVLWFADVTMPEDVVYEIAKTIYENINRFAEFHALGKLMNRENLTKIPMPEDRWHPGSRKFFNEKGIKLGK